jgi:predicted Zn-dependent protease with MMP-like domain
VGRHRRRARALIEVSGSRFQLMVGQALDDLPSELGRLMRNVAVTIDFDSPAGDLLGLYQGVPLTERTSDYSMVLRDRIVIFRKAICAMCATEDEVVDQVRRTVVHEVGHHFGIDDDRLHELGW